jgi:hypothetical protein
VVVRLPSRTKVRKKKLGFDPWGATGVVRPKSFFFSYFGPWG